MDENYQNGYPNNLNGNYPPPQQNVYGQPQPMYGQPQPTYVQPQPTYVPPQPAYVQSQPAYVPPQPAYVQPQPAYAQAQRRNNGKCIAGMILGIVRISTSWIALVPYEAWIPIAMAIVAIVLGSKGRKEISAGMPGHKMANTGRILGIVSLILSVILAAVILLLFGTFLGIAAKEGYNYNL